MAELFTAQNLVAFLTLLALETVLGIDNVIFISILADKIPEEQRDFGRQLGIGLAVVSRIVLLFAITSVQQLEAVKALTLFGNALSWKDVVLLLGGLFLIGKSTYEIHEKLDAEDTGHAVKQGTSTLSSMIAQVLIIDLVFSIDSVITAVGISDSIIVMVSAIVIAAIVMIVFSGQIASFIERHPSMKILALSFLILIGSMLVVEGWAHEAAEELHLKNYIYFAMAFSVIVDVLQLQLKRKQNKPVKLHNTPITDHSATGTD